MLPLHKIKPVETQPAKNLKFYSKIFRKVVSAILGKTSIVKVLQF
jgi:hypothetical protein